jgi:hypothetical protein
MSTNEVFGRDRLAIDVVQVMRTTLYSEIS